MQKIETNKYIFFLNFNLEYEIKFENNFCQMSCLDIYVEGKTIIETMDEFNKHFEFIYEDIYLEDDVNLENKALALKKYLKKLIKKIIKK